MQHTGGDPCWIYIRKNSNRLLYHKDNVEQLIEEAVSREVAINYVCDMKEKKYNEEDDVIKSIHESAP